MEDYTDITSRLSSVGIVANAQGGEINVLDIKDYINGVEEPQTSPSPFVPYPLGFLARQSAGALVESINQTSRPKKTMLIGHEKIFSSTALEALTPITLREMYCPQDHKGKYIVCRVIYPTARDIAAEIFVEDFNGDVTLVCAEYIPGLFQANAAILDAHFPIGTVFAIREPVMRKANNSGAQGMALLVDSPSDIVILAPSAHSDSWKTPSPDDGLSAGRSALVWKAQGNTLFRERLFIPALIAWSHALEIDPSLIAIPLNRALAYFALKWYGAAYSDASLALEMTPSETDTFKANYRMACAEYGLGMYRVALDHFRSLRDHPMALNVDDWIKRCIDRAKEQEKGDYDWPRMFRCANGCPVDLDVADYVSPSIGVTLNAKRESGRGISAVREIKAGDLLMVANPFAIIGVGELDTKESLFVVDMTTGRARTTTLIGLACRVVARMLGCPKDAARVTGMYAGPKHSPSPSDYALAPAPGHIAVNPLVGGIDIDISQVEAIVSRHAFGVKGLGPATNGSPPATATGSESSALYTSPSLFNHACHSNAAWNSFGNVMVIRATESIAPGTEITLSSSSTESYSRRQQILRRSYQESCDCVLCEADRADGETAHERREGIYADFIALLPHTQWHRDSDRSKVIDLLEAARATYSGKQAVPRPFLANMYMHVMKTLDQQGSKRNDQAQVVESIKYGLQSLEAIGFKEIDTRVSANNKLRFVLPLSKDWLGHHAHENASIMAMVCVALSFVWISEVSCAERWFRAAWWAHDAYYGGGKALFDARWGAIIRRLVGPEYAKTEYRWK